MSKDKKLTYKQKSGLAWVEQDDPPFIKAMKKKMGYKEPARLEDKFNDDEAGTADDTETEFLRMKDDDRPQVVVLNPDTDLSQDDLQKALNEKQKADDDQKIADGKIVFRKPTKRTSNADAEVDEKKKKPEKKDESKPQSRLLSFAEDEEE